MRGKNSPKTLLERKHVYSDQLGLLRGTGQESSFLPLKCGII